MLKKAFEKLSIMVEVDNTAGLSDAVHAKHGRTNVYGPEACLGSDHWTYGGPARTIVLYNEVLNWHIAELGNLPNESGSNCISHISLVCVGLYYNTFMNTWRVLRMVLLRIIRVKPVCHIS
jgi:hypothetical protein